MFLFWQEKLYFISVILVKFIDIYVVMTFFLLQSIKTIPRWGWLIFRDVNLTESVELIPMRSETILITTFIMIVVLKWFVECTFSWGSVICRIMLLLLLCIWKTFTLAFFSSAFKTKIPYEHVGIYLKHNLVDPYV